MAFYNFAPEFADIEHLHPALAVVEPYVNRPDGSVLQLEYREGECIPYAVARYHLPADAALNGAIVGGSPAKLLKVVLAGLLVWGAAVPAHAVHHPGRLHRRYFQTDAERAWLERYRLLRKNGYTEHNARQSADRWFTRHYLKGGHATTR